MKKILIVLIVIVALFSCNDEYGPIYTDLPLSFKLGESFDIACENLYFYSTELLFENQSMKRHSIDATIGCSKVLEATIGSYDDKLSLLIVNVENTGSNFIELVELIESDYGIILNVNENWATSDNNLMIKCSVTEYEDKITIVFCGYRDDEKC